MKRYGYIRVSSTDQNEDRQIIAMKQAKVPKDNIYIDKQSGKNTKRPELQRLLSAVKTGDSITVEAISRFARNTRDLLSLIDKLNEKGVEFISLKEYIDTTTPTGRFTLTIFGAVAELEREYILQRQAEGIAAAKARGVHLGRPIKKPPENFGVLVKEWERGKLPLTEVLKQTGLKEATFYRRLREWRLMKGKK